MYDPEQSHTSNRSVTLTKPQNERLTEDLAYAREALEFLETFTLQKIQNPDQREDWTLRLSRVPRWKLRKLTDFTGRLQDIWKFFDELRQAPEVYKPLELPEPKRHDDVGQLCRLYIDTILDARATTDDKDWIERIWVFEMHDRFPQVKGIQCERKGNR